MSQEERIAELEARVEELEKGLNRLKDWSDLNDYYLREMIDALTDSVDKLYEWHQEEEFKKRGNL